MLEAAHAVERRPAVLSSMRDILVTKPRMDRISRSWRRSTASTTGSRSTATPRPRFGGDFPADRIADKLHYTGYVITPADDDGSQGAADDGAGVGEIVVSAGGGAVGGDYMRWIFRNRASLPAEGRRWRFVAGPHMDASVIAEMEAGQSADVVVERSRSDLARVIGRADLSISQAGYNTVMELLAGGTPPWCCPEGGIETEQRLRADLLAKRGRWRSCRDGLVYRNLGRCDGAGSDCRAPRRGRCGAGGGCRHRRSGGGGRPEPDQRHAPAPGRHRWAVSGDRHLAPLLAELDRWGEAGGQATFWLRDDDLTAPSAALDALLATASEAAWMLALAVVPGRRMRAFQPGSPGVGARPAHGWRHIDHEWRPARRRSSAPACPPNGRWRMHGGA